MAPTNLLFPDQHKNTSNMPTKNIGSSSSGSKSRAPKYQNAQGRPFTHNANSSTTKKILALPIVGVCSKCKDKLDWRKKYRKYKPLKQPKTCNDCKKKTILAAYHVICVGCAKGRGGVCEMCTGDGSHLPPGAVGGIMKEKVVGSGEDLELKGLKEREKRAVLRRREKEVRGEVGGEEGEEGEDSGMESYDDYSEEEGEEGEAAVAEDIANLAVEEEKPAAAESIFKMAQGAPAAEVVAEEGAAAGNEEDSAAGAEEEEAHFGAGNDLFGCGESRNYAKFKF